MQKITSQSTVKNTVESTAQHKSEEQQKLTVGIIGCGWLGKAIAASLQAQNISLLATSSQFTNVEILNQAGINAEVLTLPASNTEALAQHNIFIMTVLIIAIPPQFKQGKSDYGDKISQIVTAAAHRGCVEHILLLSTTGAYTGLSGLVDETAELDLTTSKVQQLAQAEQAVLAFNSSSSKGVDNQSISKGNTKASVLRLAGLVGPERHPGKFLLAKKVITNGDAKTNLIHQQDAVGLVLSLIHSSAPQGIFNGVSDIHASKAAYYQRAAQALSLPAPKFTATETTEAGRIVCGDKAKQQLGYSFIYPDLLTWL